jgi:protein-S-isoprenylcysteine O-methyltransferase Ste14
MNDNRRYILGYIVGIGLFYIAIPAFLIGLHLVTAPLFPHPLLPLAWLRYSLIAILLLCGLGFAAWSNIALRVIGRGGPTDGFDQVISPRTQKLVTSGPYRYTRNPMAFGTFLNYLALALALNSAVLVVFIALMMPVALAYIRRYEEQRLARDFGDEFTEYAKRVPMFFPWPPGK